MRDDHFEWDNAKARRNWRKHRVAFVDARRVFDDLNNIDSADETMDYGEDRYRAVGLANGVLLSVAYTQRGNRIRIISARKADSRETSDYVNEN